MTTYTVHEPNLHTGNQLERADRIVFVKEGFSWWAFLTPPFWFVYHREWWLLAGYLIALLALVFVLQLFSVSEDAVFWSVVMLHLLIGFEANDLRRLVLDRQGSFLIATVAGTSREDCERRFFNLWLTRGQGLAATRLPE